MNPKEVSYSHPQLPLCDTPIFWPLPAACRNWIAKVQVFLEHARGRAKKVISFSYPVYFPHILTLPFFTDYNLIYIKL